MLHDVILVFIDFFGLNHYASMLLRLGHPIKMNIVLGLRLFCDVNLVFVDFLELGYYALTPR